MGCYNTVIFKCPSCGGEIAEQVKSGSCMLNTFNEDKVPIDDAGGLIGINTICYDCKKTFEICTRNASTVLRLCLIEIRKEDES